MAPRLSTRFRRPVTRLLSVEGDDSDPEVGVDGEDDHEDDEGESGVGQVFIDLCDDEKTV